MKKKCLFTVLEPFNNAGSQNVIMSIVSELSDQYVFDLLCFNDKEGDLEAEFLSYGGSIYRKRISGYTKMSNRLSFYIRARKIRKEFLRVISQYGKYDIIHANMGLESGIVLQLAYLNSIPIRIAHSHTVFPNRGNCIRQVYYRIYRNLIYRYATKMIGCSDVACEALFKSDNYRVIYNAIDLDRFKYVEDSNTTVPSLIQVATYSNNKNQMFSLAVLKSLHDLGCKAKLTLVGRCNDKNSEDYYSQLERYIKATDLEEYVSFLPGDSNVPEVMAKSTYLIFPSIKEGFGIVPVEAQAVGLKCFVSNSVPHEIDCGGCVFMALEDGARSWAERILADYNSTKGWHREYDCSRYSTEVIINEYRKLYEVEV
jgi:glycosyltransferase involved in cell wall biosynthesis